MQLRVVGNAIVTDCGFTVATFHPWCPPTIRDKAEHLLMRGAVETDWDQRMRLFEQQDRIAELEARQGELEREIAVVSARLVEIIEATEMGQ